MSTVGLCVQKLINQMCYFKTTNMCFILQILLLSNIYSTYAAKRPQPSTGIGSALDLQCPPCERLHCTPRKAHRLKCRGGVTTGVCGCCPVCAKLEGERCGGTWDYLGKCDQGLNCVTEENDVNTGVDIFYLGTVKEPTRTEDQLEGVCKIGKKKKWSFNTACDRLEALFTLS